MSDDDDYGHDEYRAEHDYDVRRMQMKEDRSYAIAPAMQGYGTENHPGRKVDRDSVARRMSAEAAVRARRDNGYDDRDWDD